ncbi:MAG: putative Zn-dependent protease [Paracoccaceae bacterium]|jgi:predicted Zn-dependent protease
MGFFHCEVMFIERLSRLGSIFVSPFPKDPILSKSPVLSKSPMIGLTLCLYLMSTIQVGAITLLRDAGIEHALSQLAAPILRSAGLSPTRVRILVVDDSKLNAFVVDNRTIFLNYGLIQRVQSAGALQAVIGHEAAHIANGHIARRMSNMQSARTAAGLGMLLAVVAAAAGSTEAAGGIAAGTSSSALRSFLKHTRTEEAAADRTAASYLRSAGISPQGLVDLHQIFYGQEALSVGRQDPYMQSHPLTRDRIRAAQAYVAAYGGSAKADPESEYWFSRARGKLSAYNRAPKWTLRRAHEENSDDIRLMREAVAYHRNRDLAPALRAIDAAIALRPDDAYYYDLKGQILMESRKTTSAIAAYRTAVSLAPGEAMIQGGYGRAILASGQPKTALGPLEKSRSRDFRDTRVLRDLSLAYAKTGQTGMAAMVTAERYALQGRMPDAGRQARRASNLLPRGSAPWQRAQDVLIAAERFEKRKKKR